MFRNFDGVGREYYGLDEFSVELMRTLKLQVKDQSGVVSKLTINNHVDISLKLEGHERRLNWWHIPGPSWHELKETIVGEWNASTPATYIATNRSKIRGTLARGWEISISLRHRHWNRSHKKLAGKLAWVRFSICSIRITIQCLSTYMYGDLPEHKSTLP